MWLWHRLLCTVLLVATTAFAATRVEGQSVYPSRSNATYSRAELEAALRAAEGDAKRSDEAAMLRARLQNGDFSAGDRVVFQLFGDSALYDTLTVRAGPSLRIPNIPDVPLKGVLRSELQDYLTKYLARYIRNPELRAESLIRLSILGEVGKPGFYDFNSDILLTDAIMAAGGPTGRAALESTIRRGSNVVLAKERVRRAAQSGATLDRLGLRPGDELTVGEKRQRLSATAIMGFVGAAASLALTLLFFANR